MSLTRKLGRFVAATSLGNLPPEAIATARLGFTDTIATMVAGADEPAPRLEPSRRAD